MMKVYKDLSNEDYHAHGQDYISSTFVKRTHEHSVSKALEPMTVTQPFIDGDRFHCLMQEDEEFNERFYVVDRPDDTEIVNNLLDLDWCIKKGLKKSGDKPYTNPSMTGYYKNWLAKNTPVAPEGKELMFTDELNWFKCMAKGINNNLSVQQLNSMGSIKNEMSYFFNKGEDIVDPETGEVYTLPFSMRVRPDRSIMLDSKSDIPNIILDWKTCQSATYKDVRKDIFNRNYDIQVVFYAFLLGVKAENFYLVFIEKQSPYNSLVVGLDDETIERAREKMFRALDRIKLWKETGEDGIEHKNEIVRI